MRRIALLLAAAAVVASTLSVTPAIAHEGWHGGDHQWRGDEQNGYQWGDRDWRERDWRRHQSWEHHGWDSGYYGYYAPPAYRVMPGVTFGFAFR